MPNVRLTLAVAIAGLIFGHSQTLAAKELTQIKSGEPVKFIRILRDASGTPEAMQTSIIRYAPAQSSSSATSSSAKAVEYVDLISAVHIGEKGYYEKLNQLFKNYDAVLYELVAPEGTRVPAGGGTADHPVAKIQHGMKDLLGLEYQLAIVDYSPANFIHADMTPEQFSKSMEDRGESAIGMIFKAMGQSLAQQSTNRVGSDIELIGALVSKDRPAKLKRIMAQQFEDLDRAIAAFSDGEGSTILTERNKTALGVLNREIASGKKRIAIFYGGGHMPDMDRRLQSEFNLQPQKELWLTAWDLKTLDP